MSDSESEEASEEDSGSEFWSESESETWMISRLGLEGGEGVGHAGGDGSSKTPP
jgi:hypothetical protein